MKIDVICFHCGKKFLREKKEVNKTIRKGGNLFCGFSCFNDHRGCNKSPEEKKKIKLNQQSQWRKRNREKCLKKNREWREKNKSAMKDIRASWPSENKNVRSKYQKKYNKTDKGIFSRRRRYSVRVYGEFWEIKMIELQIKDETSLIKRKATGNEHV
jgi:hypothetical protein